MAGKKSLETFKWLLVFYTVPSKPVGNRVRLWRKLACVGAISLKGAVYVLPYNEEHYELCQWLISEVQAVGGEGDFVVVDNFEMAEPTEIVALFNAHRQKELREFEKKLQDLASRLESIYKGGKPKNAKALQDQVQKLTKEFEEIKARDFFSAPGVALVGRRLERLKQEVQKILSTHGKKTDFTLEIPSRQIGDYQGKIWVTRKNPFVDRMASAWLIRRFIDPEATFRFVGARSSGKAVQGAVTFDMKGGEFTHVGDMCTFEVLVKSFGLKDSALKRIAEIVHGIDIKDEKYKPSEAKGVEEILLGIRKNASSDQEALEQGMMVFEALYGSKRP